MHLSKRAGLIALTLAMVLIVVILWPSSPAEILFDRYELSSSSEFVSALDKAETFSFSHINFIQGASLQVHASPSIAGAALASISGDGYDYQNQTFNYTVQSGDTVSSIAEKFKVSVETILWANDLQKNSTLRAGGTLIILPVSGTMHLVGRNETISHIAKSYKVKESEILSFNQLGNANEIFIGDLLIIPGGQRPVQPQIVSRQPIASSYFIRPTSGRITQGLHYYNAIDIANSCGTPIYAAAAGTVQRAGYISIGGNRVQIIHANGVVTYYGHLSQIHVSPGQAVAQGQEIGRMGTTGWSTGCHLHFDVRGATNPLAQYPVGSYLAF
jgi:murein DD-endopeptidase MepM/ murein hydrolase activator NlpD